MLHKIAFVLLIIGGLNWLLTAFNYGVQSYMPAPVSMIIFVLVGLAALYEVFTHKSNCRHCEVKTS